MKIFTAFFASYLPANFQYYYNSVHFSHSAKLNSPLPSPAGVTQERQVEQGKDWTKYTEQKQS
jgi:hypothetical protein